MSRGSHDTDVRGNDTGRGARRMKSCIIIGAGSGVSEAVALRFGTSGCRMGLIARNPDNLASLSQRLVQAVVDVAWEVVDAPALRFLQLAYVPGGQIETNDTPFASWLCERNGHASSRPQWLHFPIQKHLKVLLSRHAS